MADCICYIGVKNKVEKVISAVQGWADVVFVPVMFPAKVHALGMIFFKFLRIACGLYQMYGQTVNI